MSRYRKSQFQQTIPTNWPAREHAFAKPAALCTQCRGSGVVKDDENPARIARCPCGKSPGQHSVRKRLQEQDEQDARLRDVMIGKGW